MTQLAARTLPLLFAAAAVAGPTVLDAQSGGGSAPPPARLWAAQISPREVTLAWDSVPGATGFRLYQRGGAGDRQIGNVVNRVLRYVVVVKPEMVGTPQQFRIETLDAAGRPSSRVDFNTVTPVAARPGGPPLAGPTSVTLRASGDGITVSWDAVPGATAYVIGRAVRPGGYRPLCQLCSTSTTYVDRTAVPNGVHSYSVVALTPTVSSRATRSDTLTFTGTVVAGGGGGGGGGTGGSGGTGGTGGTGGGTTGTIAAPTELTARLVMPAAAALTWHTVMGATGYPVTRALCGGAPQLVTTRPGDGMNTEPATVYWQDNMSATTIAQLCTTQRHDVVYTVAATNAAGSSTRVTFPTLQLDLAAIAAAGSAASQTVPVAPTQLAARQSDATTVHLSWMSSPGATRYTIGSTYCGSASPDGAITIEPPVSTSPTPLSQDVGDISTGSFLETCGDSTRATIVFTIKASNTAGTSPVATFPSVVFTVAPTVVAGGGGTTVTVPQAPAGLSARLVLPTVPHLSWRTSEGATAYPITRALCGGPPQLVTSVQDSVATPAGLEAVWEDHLSPTMIGQLCTAMRNDVVYTIAAANSAGSSPQVAFTALRLDLMAIALASGTTTTTTQPLPPPGGLTIARYSTSPASFRLAWQGVAGATGYRVTRSLCRQAPQVLGTAGGIAWADTVTAAAVRAQCSLGFLSTTVNVVYGVTTLNTAGAAGPVAFFPSQSFTMPIGIATGSTGPAATVTDFGRSSPTSNGSRQFN